MISGPRVLMVGLNFSPETTGIAPYTARTAAGLAQVAQVACISAFPHYPAWEIAPGYGGWKKSEVLDGVKLTRLRHYIPANPTGISRIASEFTFAARFLTQRNRNVDVIVAVTPALLPTAAAAWRAWRTNTPFGVIVQDLYGRAVKELRLGGGVMSKATEWLERRVLRAASGVVVIHERIGDSIIRDYGVDPNRISVIPNWTHIGNASGDRLAIRQQLGWEGKTVVLHAGNMGSKQGLETVLEAAASQSSSQYHFVLMGDGSERQRLRAAAEGNPNLSFREPVQTSDLPDVLAAADVLLLNESPGVSEMCVPSKLTSYFAAGRPVVGATWSEGAAAREIEKAGAGVVVAPGSPAKLLIGVERALRLDPESVKRNAKAHVESTLSENRALDLYKEWLSKLQRVQPPA